MITIRKKVSLLLILCSIIAIFLISTVVNFTINNKFNKYILDIQQKRDLRIVQQFQDVYRNEGKWTGNSGMEAMHEAYMGNYCITLYDVNKNVVWGMNPNDSRFKEHLEHMNIKDKGVYKTKSFEIKNINKIVGYVSIGQYSSVLFSEEDLTFKDSINKSIIMSSVFTILIILLISLYFSSEFSKPVKEVANMSVNLSKGDFTVRSSIKSNIVELEDLRKSINILGEKLKYQDQLRRKLVSDISHEIRTPLNVLQNNLEAMIDGIFPLNNDRLRSLNDEVIRFGKLIQNLNVLKEFEEESIKLNFERVDIKQIIESVCKDFYMKTKEKSIQINYDIEENKAYEIIGDRDKLKQVFINLISNAIKFNREKGYIWIKMYKIKSSIFVEIKDEGIGISERDKEFIFERFYRGEKGKNYAEGNGIGLTIARDILKLHSATIEVDSKEGEGSKFILIFK